jgi:RNA polymerase sigma-70 factor (ECF subfamily)
MAPTDSPLIPRLVSLERPAAQETDVALVAQLVTGDERALRVLHARYASLVFSIAARIVDASAAEEVVQDVFVTVWRKAEAFDPERGSFKSWILQIARHRALNELRKRHVRRAEGEDKLAEVADERAMPDEAQWAAHRRTTIQKAIDALPAPEKQALSLAFFEELTHEQVAAVLRMPLGTAKTRIRGAIKHLAPALLALVAAVAIAIAWRRENQQQAMNQRSQRALQLVTASDVAPIRLGASPSVPPEAHGTFRAKTGTDIAVLTASNLPAPKERELHMAWVRHGERWSLLGHLEPTDQVGRWLLVVQSQAVASPVDEVRVTQERQTGAAPSGPMLLDWQTGRDR